MRQLFTALVISLFVVSLTTGAARAQADLIPELIAPLPTGDARTDEFQLREGPTIRRSGFTAVNTDTLTRFVTDRAADEPADTPFGLRLFEDLLFTLVPERIEPQLDGRIAIVGHEINNRNNRGYLVVNGGQLTGDLTLGADKFEIRALGLSVQSVAEMNQFGFVDELEPTAPDLPNTQDVPPLSGDGQPPVIDVLVAYTRASEDADGDIGSEIILAVLETNDSYSNSGIVQRIRLVATMPVDYLESGDILTDRNSLQASGDGVLDDVLAKRDEVAADLVSLWVERAEGGVCGIAYIMEAITPAFAPFGVSVVRRECATGYYSFGHEFGHIMGARHDRRVDPTENSPASYNHAHVVPEKGWRTIMGYNAACADQGIDCTRIQYWSNPEVALEGTPLGVAEGEASPADNRKMLNLSGPTVAAFR